MRVYFHANNKATLDALQKCGVRNVLVSHKYSHNISTFTECFDNILITAGTNDDPEKYYEFLKTEKGNYQYATQYSVPNNMNETMVYWNKANGLGLDTIPILQEDYVKHLSLLNLPVGSHIAIGKMRGRFDTEDSLKKIPTNNRYHGMGKGKYIDKGIFESIDTSLWISAAMSKKCDIWHNSTKIPMTFGENSSVEPVLEHYCELYKDNMEKIGINLHGVKVRHYYTMLKLPIALYYMPLLKHLKSYSDNFIN